MTISVGVATLEPEHDRSATVERLQDAADAALYQANREGRNRVKVA
jgi:PleD family two-component response regulator